MALPEFRKWNPWRVAAGATVALTLFSCAMWLIGIEPFIGMEPRAAFDAAFLIPFGLAPLLFLFGIIAVWVNWRWGVWAFAQVLALLVAVVYGYFLELERYDLWREEAAAERAASAPP